MKKTNSNNMIRSVIICAFACILCVVTLTGCGAKDEPESDNAYDMLEKYAISQAEEKGIAFDSSENLEQNGKIAGDSFPQGIVNSAIIEEDTEKPCLIIAGSSDGDSIINLSAYSYKDGEVKECEKHSYRYTEYSPSSGTVLKFNSYIHKYNDKPYVVVEEYTTQGAAANQEIWQTIYLIENGELIKEKELGYQLMAGLATRWPQYFIDGEVLEGFAEANMDADDTDALIAASEKNQAYSQKSMARFTEIRESYGLDSPDNNYDLNFENDSEGLLARLFIDCNSDEYVLKSGGIIRGETSEAAKEPEKETDSNGNAYSEYIKLLEENADSIKGYNWQNGNSEYASRPLKPIAFCDINGNDIPELFIMKKTKDASDTTVDTAELFIYTFKDGEVKEIPYDLSADKTISKNNQYKRITDEYVSAAGRYLIYKGKGNTLNMYALTGGTSLVYHVYSFDVDANCNLTLRQCVENYYETDNPGKVDIYYKDGEEVSDKADGVSLFKAAFTDFDKPIVGSNYEDEDISTLTNQFNESDLLSMNYEDAITYCKNH